MYVQLSMHTFLCTLFVLGFAIASPTPSKSATVVFQFPNTTSSSGLLPWIENIAQRKTGELLVTRLDVPELWIVDPEKDTAALIHEFPPSKTGNGTSLYGIAEYAPDKWAVNYMSYHAPSFDGIKGECGIYTIDLTGSTSKVEFLLLPNLTFPNGLAVAHATDHSCKYESVLLSTDYVGGGVNVVDPITGTWKYTPFYPELLPGLSSSSLVGTNGLKIVGNFLYYTAMGKYFRLPISLQDLFADLTITPTAPAELIATLGDTDDLYVVRDGTAYVADNRQNQIVKVDLDGRMVPVAGSLNSSVIAGPTSCVLDEKRMALFVSTTGGQIAPVNGTYVEPGKVVMVPL